jgi:hypothetical protein
VGAVVSGVLADLVLVIHLGFIAFAVLGALLVLRWRWTALLHLPALAWAAWIELTSGVCPLTPLENALRRSAGESGYAGSFIAHYLVPLIYPPGLTPRAQLWLAVCLIAVNLVLYGYVCVRHFSAERRID